MSLQAICSVEQAVVTCVSCSLLQTVVVVAEVVVVASVAVEALGEVPQGMAVAVALPMGPLPMAVLVVDTAMDVSSLHTSQPPVHLSCLVVLLDLTQQALSMSVTYTCLAIQQ